MACRIYETDTAIQTSESITRMDQKTKFSKSMEHVARSLPSSKASQIFIENVLDEVEEEEADYRLLVVDEVSNDC